MSAQVQESPKYNLYELINEKYLSVRDGHESDRKVDTFDRKVDTLDADTKQTITQAFRKAADNVASSHVGSLVEKLGVAATAFIVVGDSITSDIGLYNLPRPLVAWALGISVCVMLMGRIVKTIQNRWVFERQFKDEKTGFALDADAAGNKMVFEKAVNLIDEFTRAKRPRASSNRAPPAPDVN
jgi:hypothetical protein